jgi:hypothetical protein
MSKSIDNLTAVQKAFEVDGSQWDVYGFAFASMDNGRILLREIIAIASLYGIKEDVVRLRRLQWLDMKKGPLADLAYEY